MTRLIAILPFVLTALTATVPAVSAPVTEVSACGAVLSAPGRYSMPADLLACPGAAIVIAASEVSLDLKGNEITCDRADGRLDVGVLGSGVSAVHVRNGRISGCDIGVQVVGVTDSEITDLSIQLSAMDAALGIGGAAILLVGSDHNAVIGNRATENIIGIGIFNSHDNQVTGNVTSENVGEGPIFFGMGIALSAFSSGNSLRGNEARFNSDAGIVLSVGVSGTTVRGNEVSDNGFYGIGAFRRIDLGAPPTQNNLIQGNSSLANGRADLVEVLFDPLANPRESTEELCRNTWKDNTHVSLIGPPDCVR